MLICRLISRTNLGTQMNNIAVSYRELGRHHDALDLQEKTLEFRRRVLPQNHPDIGVM